MSVGCQSYDLFHALCVEFVEYVVEQQQWCGFASRLSQEVELCQLEAYEECLVLALRAFALEWVAVECEVEVVAVYAVE